MLRSIVEKFQKLFNQAQYQPKENRVDENQSLSSSLEQNLSDLKGIFENCSDLVFREFQIGSKNSIGAALIYIDGLANITLISENVLKPLMQGEQAEKIDAGSVYNIVKDRLITLGNVAETAQVNNLVAEILKGTAALLWDGSNAAFLTASKGWEDRVIEEPATEAVVRGPRDGFTENISTNITLLRRRIKTPRLKIETMVIGLLTKTEVRIAYIKGIINDKVVEEVKIRLSRINTDAILESGYIEEFIEDEPFSPFSQINITERPDKVAGSLLEGQFAIFVDNTPFVLLAPSTFPQLLTSSEDYYNRYPWGSFVRMMRFITLNLSLLLTAFYVAITTFHPGMIPTPLLLSIASSKESLPLPTLVEALMMEGVFEILREAGVRMPRAIGAAVSIVGALVIGEAGVTARIISPAMVIVIAISAVSALTMPSVQGSIAIRLMKFPIIVFAGTLGLFGIIISLLFILIHLNTLRSFGVPFLSPIAPSSFGDLKDSILRFPRWAMNTRPRLYGYKDPIRQGSMQKPRTPPAKRKGGG